MDRREKKFTAKNSFIDRQQISAVEGGGERKNITGEAALSESQ